MQLYKLIFWKKILRENFSAEPLNCAQFSLRNFFQKCPCRPAAGRPGPGRPAAGRSWYIPVNFQIENIFFVKNENKK
jgi:hypothetical protein